MCLCVRVFVCVMRARVSVCKNTEEEEEDNNNKKKTREKDIFSLTRESKIQMSLDILFYIVFVQLCALDYMRYYASVKSYTHRLRFVSRHLEHFYRTFQPRQCLRQIRRKKASSRERQTE